MAAVRPVSRSFAGAAATGIHAQHSKYLADAAPPAGGLLAKGRCALNLIAVTAGVLLLDGTASLGQGSHDAEDAPLGDPQSGSNIVQANPGVTRYAQHFSTAGA